MWNYWFNFHISSMSYEWLSNCNMIFLCCNFKGQNPSFVKLLTLAPFCISILTISAYRFPRTTYKDRNSWLVSFLIHNKLNHMFILLQLEGISTADLLLKKRKVQMAMQNLLIFLRLWIVLLKRNNFDSFAKWCVFDSQRSKRKQGKWNHHWKSNGMDVFKTSN